MFARYTHARMKGSAIVQGLKDWASKLHPQLPLSQRESHRLLTALTGSFRAHLDEVHPHKAAEDAKHKVEDAGVAKTSRHAMHSSAVLADKHLSSVLTNLTNPGAKVKKADQNFANAQMELQKNPAKDPISLLEEYHEKDAATVPIARLCLQVFKKSLEGLSQAAQQKEITEVEAGKRVLLWLWRSRQHQLVEFVDDRTFIELLVSALMKESQEHYIWAWMEIDQVLADEQNHYKGVQQMYHRYRWKGRLLRAMVLNNLDSPYRERKSADAAVRTYLKACDMKASAPKNSHMEYLPLGQAATAIYRALTNYTHEYSSTNPELYDNLIDVVKLSQDKQVVYTDLQTAALWLHHPTKPSARPALRFWQRCFNENEPSLAWQRFTGGVKRVKPNPNPQELAWYMIMATTVARLREEGRWDEARWLEARVRETYPTAAQKYLDKDLEKYRLHGKILPDDVIKHEPVADRVSYPTFAWSPT